MVDFAKLRAKKIISDLLNRTVARGCTQAEAIQATEKIAELCTKYGLTAEPEQPQREAPWKDYRDHSYYNKPRGRWRDTSDTWEAAGRWKRRARATNLEPRHTLQGVRSMLKRAAALYGLEGARAILREAAGVGRASDLQPAQYDRVYAACERRMKQAAGDIFAEAGL